MKAIQISKTSWHYRFMSWCNQGHVDASDICEYSRKLVLRLIGVSIGVLFLSILAGFFMFLIGSTIAWAVASVASLSFLPPEPPAAVMLFVGIFAGVPLALFVLIKQNYDTIAERLDTPFIRDAFTAWKQKWCARVEFVNRDK